MSSAVTSTHPGREARPLGLDEPGFPAAYRASTPIAVEHSLANHPLLALDAVADLADWLPRDSVICDTADQPLLVPEGGPPRGSEPRPGDVIRHLDEKRSWLTLLNIEQHAPYRELMDSCLDQVAAVIERRRGDMRRRAGFIFVSSPRSVTPAHFDIEHSLLLQISGHKEVTVGRFATVAMEQHERNRYWDGHHGRVENLPVAIGTHDLAPGRGVYIPPVCPHWVRNGDAISVSMTLTFFSSDSERDQLVEAFNARLRRLRVHPRPQGRSPQVDAVKAGAMRLWQQRSRIMHRGNGSTR
jgi:JmjC domain